MDLKELITYAEEKEIITLVDADELRNYLDVLENTEESSYNQEVRIEELEDKLLETTDSLFRYRKECDTIKKKLKRWKTLLSIDGENTKKVVKEEIEELLNEKN